MVVEIDEATKREVMEIFKRMDKPVKLYVFTTEKHCLYCSEVEEIVDKLSELAHGRIEVAKCKCDVDTPEARELRVARHPAIVIKAEGGGLLKYYGVPSGYEFGVLVETIMAASTGDLAMPLSVIDLVRKVEKRAHIQVFVTPTCPYCPVMALTAFKFALINENVEADVIESMEFPELVRQYNVFAVPKTVINDKVEFEGAIPEPIFASKLLEAVMGEGAT